MSNKEKYYGLHKKKENTIYMSRFENSSPHEVYQKMAREYWLKTLMKYSDKENIKIQSISNSLNCSNSKYKTIQTQTVSSSLSSVSINSYDSVNVDSCRTVVNLCNNNPDENLSQNNDNEPQEIPMTLDMTTQFEDNLKLLIKQDSEDDEMYNVQIGGTFTGSIEGQGQLPYSQLVKLVNQKISEKIIEEITVSRLESPMVQNISVSENVNINSRSTNLKSKPSLGSEESVTYFASNFPTEPEVKDEDDNKYQASLSRDNMKSSTEKVVKPYESNSANESMKGIIKSNSKHTEDSRQDNSSQTTEDKTSTKASENSKSNRSVVSDSRTKQESGSRSKEKTEDSKGISNKSRKITPQDKTMSDSKVGNTTETTEGKTKVTTTSVNAYDSSDAKLYRGTTSSRLHESHSTSTSRRPENTKTSSSKDPQFESFRNFHQPDSPPAVLSKCLVSRIMRSMSLDLYSEKQSNKINASIKKILEMSDDPIYQRFNWIGAVKRGKVMVAEIVEMILSVNVELDVDNGYVIQVILRDLHSELMRSCAYLYYELEDDDLIDKACLKLLMDIITDEINKLYVTSQNWFVSNREQNLSSYYIDLFNRHSSPMASEMSSAIEDVRSNKTTTEMSKGSRNERKMTNDQPTFKGTNSRDNKSEQSFQTSQNLTRKGGSYENIEYSMRSSYPNQRDSEVKDKINIDLSPKLGRLFSHDKEISLPTENDKRSQQEFSKKSSKRSADSQKSKSGGSTVVPVSNVYFVRNSIITASRVKKTSNLIKNIALENNLNLSIPPTNFREAILPINSEYDGALMLYQNPYNSIIERVKEYNPQWAQPITEGRISIQDLLEFIITSTAQNKPSNKELYMEIVKELEQFEQELINHLATKLHESRANENKDFDSLCLELLAEIIFEELAIAKHLFKTLETGNDEVNSMMLGKLYRSFTGEKSNSVEFERSRNPYSSADNYTLRSPAEISKMLSSEYQESRKSPYSVEIRNDPHIIQSSGYTNSLFNSGLSVQQKETPQSLYSKKTSNSGSRRSPNVTEDKRYPTQSTDPIPMNSREYSKSKDSKKPSNNLYSNRISPDSRTPENSIDTRNTQSRSRSKESRKTHNNERQSPDNSNDWEGSEETGRSKSKSKSKDIETRTPSNKSSKASKSKENKTNSKIVENERSPSEKSSGSDGSANDEILANDKTVPLSKNTTKYSNESKSTKRLGNLKSSDIKRTLNNVEGSERLPKSYDSKRTSYIYESEKRSPRSEFTKSNKTSRSKESRTRQSSPEDRRSTDKSKSKESRRTTNTRNTERLSPDNSEGSEESEVSYTTTPSKSLTKKSTDKTSRSKGSKNSRNTDDDRRSSENSVGSEGSNDNEKSRSKASKTKSFSKKSTKNSNAENTERNSPDQSIDSVDSKNTKRSKSKNSNETSPSRKTTKTTTNSKRTKTRSESGNSQENSIDFRESEPTERSRSKDTKITANSGKVSSSRGTLDSKKSSKNSSDSRKSREDVKIESSENISIESTNKSSQSERDKILISKESKLTTPSSLSKKNSKNPSESKASQSYITQESKDKTMQTYTKTNRSGTNQYDNLSIGSRRSEESQVRSSQDITYRTPTPITQASKDRSMQTSTKTNKSRTTPYDNLSAASRRSEESQIRSSQEYTYRTNTNEGSKPYLQSRNILSTERSETALKESSNKTNNISLEKEQLDVILGKLNQQTNQIDEVKQTIYSLRGFVEQKLGNFRCKLDQRTSNQLKYASNSQEHISLEKLRVSSENEHPGSFSNAKPIFSSFDSLENTKVRESIARSFIAPISTEQRETEVTLKTNIQPSKEYTLVDDEDVLKLIIEGTVNLLKSRRFSKNDKPPSMKRTDSCQIYNDEFNKIFQWVAQEYNNLLDNFRDDPVKKSIVSQLKTTSSKESNDLEYELIRQVVNENNLLIHQAVKDICYRRALQCLSTN